LPTAAVTLTVPPRVSTTLPIGIFSWPVSAVKPLAPGSLIVTVPVVGCARNEMPCSGSSGAGGASFGGSVIGPTGSEALHSAPRLFSWVSTRMKCPTSAETIA
jgi:hypothetical protein